MAEAARCGRRKQRNPKRKNVENDDVDTSINKKKKEVETETVVEEKQENSIHDNSGHDNSTISDHDNGKTTPTHSNHDMETDVDKDELKDTVIPDIPDKVMIPDPTTVVKENHEEVLEKPVLEPEPVKVADLPCKPLVCVALSTGCVTEEEKIQEYLNRSDTAVIYPEPVSDREGEEEEEDDNSSKNEPDSDSLMLPGEEVILRCIHCDQSFMRATLLRDHMKMIHPDKPIKYLCPKCDETFLLKSQLDKHLALHSPTSQSCKICNKTFANVYRLQRHMISHDESTDLRKFKCPECGKAFKFKHHLKEHVRIHSGEKPFQCPNCGKRFSHSGSYSSHMTSKKCWVMNQNKPRSLDQNSNAETASVSYSPIRTPVTAIGMETMIQSLTAGKFSPAFLHFDPTKGGLPYYTPPSGYLPMAYTVRHGNPIKPIMTPMIHHQKPLECQPTSVPSTSPSTSMPLSQISPDVNSNTQLISKQASLQVDGSIPIPASVAATIAATVAASFAETRTTPVSARKEATPTDKPVSPLPCNIKTEKFTDSEMDISEKPELMPDTSRIKQEHQNGEGTPCRFCGDSFHSPVDQHQHERYLCKLNKEIIHRIPSGESARNSPCSTMSESGSHRDTPNGSISAEAETDTEEIEELYKSEKNSPMESKKFRMRSLISDDQLKVLKSHYQVNPRPRKYELIRIGNEIGLPKRVVQVWFQNQRARDRRRGMNVPYFPSMARFKRQESPSAQWKETTPKTSTPNYIAVVPTPYAHGVKVNGKVTPPKRTPTGEEQPLDLSVKMNKPPDAHSGSRSSSATPPSSRSGETTSRPGDQVLNLSTRVGDASKPGVEGSLQNSAIYKYMQQEGLFAAHRHLLTNAILTSSPSLIRPLSTPTIPRRELSVTPTPSISSLSDIARSHCERARSTPSDKFENSSDGHHRDFENGREGDHRLVIDEQSDMSEDDDSSHSYECSTAMADATCNLSTLAEVSLAEHHNITMTADGEIKVKRLRKKSWRQMEAEEAQLELDESLLDEDHPFRKKRRSWKNHRLDSEEGLYACDQCKKMFSKQSSLARHKYEHSGARPFSCELCGKAFKHKHHLTEHRRLHSGEKPFQCKKCGKRFSHSGSYSQHMNHRYKYCKPMRGEEGHDDHESHDGHEMMDLHDGSSSP
ncbi:zinc finger E-box-binding homeobox 2-like isoform X2 [Mizuhopecten yessoensis]|uniref:zinc finger E-box-binding homeobox 2-like isoform X2 n=1 Tax=Mizuhopecten yessoensis TaxID=6573 RepID=UPI000B45DE32|nr:zinc finger E-box-binding homeobox 2-like isoform X2 [Mizuhopecten yessoensis]